MARDFDRALLAAAGIAGALGVATAAGAAHLGQPNLTIAADFLLFHAAALIGIALLASRLAIIAGWVLVVGLVLFAGDLTVLSLNGTSPLPAMAPIGGGLLIIGWLLLAASAFTGRRGGPAA
ncbi:MAG TPA: DUF423 domain-containing protein [Devosia sp.]|nr:DUF423 domain-containing protein [Devosia sp.]